MYLYTKSIAMTLCSVTAALAVVLTGLTEEPVSYTHLNCLFRTMTSPNASGSCRNSCHSHHNEKGEWKMEKTGEMNLYLYVDGRGRMTIPSALRCRTGMGNNSFRCV